MCCLIILSFLTMWNLWTNNGCVLLMSHHCCVWEMPSWWLYKSQLFSLPEVLLKVCVVLFFFFWAWSFFSKRIVTCRVRFFFCVRFGRIMLSLTEQLINLTIMSIEQQLIDEIVFDNVIEESANKNQERLLSKKLSFLFLKWQQVKTPPLFTKTPHFFHNKSL